MVGVMIIILLLSYFFIIKPKYNQTLLAIEVTAQQQQKLYADQQKKLNNLKIISDLYKKISETDLKKFNGVLPDNYVKEKLFGEFEEIINKNGYILNSVTLDAEKASEETAEVTASTTPGQSGKIGKINLQLAISAVDYKGFKNLLRLLENNLRLFDVSNVSFSAGGNTTNLTLTTYYYIK
jgi:LPS O-antigen subunit length determinant protein (WzzB/FepE family)